VLRTLGLKETSKPRRSWREISILFTKGSNPDLSNIVPTKGASMKTIITPKLANKKEETSIRTAVMVIKNSEGKTLILQRSSTAKWEPNKWNLPGGHIEEGESPKDAAIRECKEESGIIPTDVRFVEVFDDVGGYDIHAYVGKIDSNKVVINFESSDYAWITSEEISDYDCVDMVGKMLSKSL